MDCGENTSVLNEYYMVQFNLWERYVPEHHGMLCIGCLETRMGRELTSADFIDALINRIDFRPHSERLLSRLTR
ncbi:MAG: hypothetical protein H9W81_09915 [Enterococcus sp.]|nr:hypothetical protein [Enterococcus sp.]